MTKSTSSIAAQFTKAKTNIGQTKDHGTITLNHLWKS